MSSGYAKLYAHQGDEERWQVSSGGSPQLNLSGVTLSGDIRKEYSTDVVGSFTFEVVDLSIGQFNIVLSPETSAALPFQGNKMAASFVYDIQYTVGSPEIPTTLMYGHLLVQREVTS